MSAQTTAKQLPDPASISVVGFDLDNTLHQYLEASSVALAAMFQAIHGKYGTPLEELRRTYAKILGEAQAGAFIEGKSAYEHRAERISKLLESVSVSVGDNVFELVELYRERLGEALCLNEGAKDALKEAKRQNLRTVVITEGPHDAQQWTLEKLKITKLVDFLITTGKEGVSKENGLFRRALLRTQCPPDAFVFIGDSLERDMLPAQAAGMKTILLDKNADQRKHNDCVITSLVEVANWLKDAEKLSNQ